MIDKYIEASKKMDALGGGSNKKCYVFDDAVLLKGSFVNKGEEYQIRKERLNFLKQNGVNVCTVLENATINGERYELQEKAKGKELFHQEYSPTLEEQQNFLETLDSLSSKDLSFYEKFLNDWDKILQMGFDVDPSKSSNFFYDGESISFIDLNITNNYDVRRPWMLREAAVVLRGGGLLWQCKDVFEEAKEKVKIIYQKIGKVGLSLGEDIEEFILYADPYGRFDLQECFKSYKK